MNEMNSEHKEVKKESKKPFFLKRMGRRLSKRWKSLPPGSGVRKGATVGLAILVFLLAVVEGFFIRPGFPGLFDNISGILFALIYVAILYLLVTLALKILQVLPRFLNVSGLVLLVVYVVILRMFQFPFLSSLLVGLGAAFLGGSIAFLFGKSFKAAGRGKKIFVFLVLILILALNIRVIFWFASRGNDKHLVERRVDPVTVERLQAEDPSIHGPHEVFHTTYGSGTDKHRPEFEEEVGIRTDPVDAEPFIKNNKGWKMKLRKWYWGFDFETFPINGRVWYPSGNGPFPLVLCVHGNHKMEEFSDPGYAYLGEHLASRGFIFVSVDENFFNGSWISNLRGENDGRGWMLLQHFRTWRGWNREEGHPFFQKIDMDNLGIIGHSRGGEAAGHAGCFNRLAHYPDDATVAFDFNFNIKAIVAIAPSDGQYKPSGKPTPLENVNYLTLQGAHDADVSSFSGARQYNRVRFSDGSYWFKASIYSYRSNHGQFNTVWGDSDYGKPSGIVLNKKALLDSEDQRRFGKVYIAAFLEAALHGRREYIPLFRDFRVAAHWLPEDIYINRFEDSSYRIIGDYEEDVDVTTATLEGTGIFQKHLALWREEDLGLRRSGTKANNVVYLGWRRDSVEETLSIPPAYTLDLPDNIGQRFNLDQDSLLVFNLAAADESPPEPEEKEEDEEEKNEIQIDVIKAGEEKQEMKKKKKGKNKDAEKKEEEPLDLSVELVTSQGIRVSLPLSSFRAIPPILESRFTKYRKESKIYGKSYEPNLQLFELPLKDFMAENPEFDPSWIKRIRFVFDRTEKGVVILDNIGFARK